MASKTWGQLIVRFGSVEAARQHAREYQRKRREDRAVRERAAEIRRKYGRKRDRKTGDAGKSRLCLRARKRGRERGLESTIRRQDLHWPEICPVLGIPLIYGGNTVEPGTATLDRWDNSIGYVPGNVFVISFRANTLKNSATVAEVEKVLLYMQLGPILCG